MSMKIEKYRKVLENSPNNIISCYFNLTRNVCEGSYVRSENFNYKRKKEHTADYILEQIYMRCVKSYNNGIEKRPFKRERLIEHYLLGDYELEQEFIFRKEDGSTGWVSISVVLFQEDVEDIGAIMYCTDIQHTKILEQLMNAVIDQSYDEIFIIDIEQKSCRAFGQHDHLDISRGTYIKNIEKSFERYLRKYYVGDDLENFIKKTKIDECMKQLDQKIGYSYTYFVRNANGNVMRKRIAFSYKENEKNILIAIRYDITALFEEEVSKNKMLESALGMAQQASDAKTDFLKNVYHKMLTPISGINGILELVLQNEQYKEDEMFVQLQNSVAQLTHIIESVVDMTIMEQGQLQLDVEPVRPTVILEKVQEVCEEIAQRNNISLEFEIEYDDEVYYYMDVKRVKQILIYLIYNAIIYNKPQGRVTCKFYRKVVGNRMFATGEICDTGVGMRESFLQKALVLFEREGALTNEEGIGLGLPIVKHLMDSMNGRLDIRSVVNEGTCVFIEIPIEFAKKPMYCQEKVEFYMEEFEKLDFSYVQALIIESNDINRSVLATHLKQMGLTVDEAASGKQGVDMFTESEDGTYDIVFINIKLPLRNGLHFAGEIRMLNRQDVQDIPMVGIISTSYAEYKKQFIQYGLDYHINTPYTAKEIKEVLIKEFYVCENKKIYEQKGFRIIK